MTAVNDNDNDFITNSEIAAIMKVDKKSLSIIKAHNKDFPKPVSGKGCVGNPYLMKRSEFFAWLKKHPQRWFKGQGETLRPERKFDMIDPFNQFAVRFIAGHKALEKTLPYFAAAYDTGPSR